MPKMTSTSALAGAGAPSLEAGAVWGRAESAAVMLATPQCSCAETLDRAAAGAPRAAAAAGGSFRRHRELGRVPDSGRVELAGGVDRRPAQDVGVGREGERNP